MTVISFRILLGKEQYQWDDIFDSRRQLTYQGAKDRDERRFKAADQNKDGKLTKDEYSTYIRPENVPHMKNVVIDVSPSSEYGCVI